MSNEILNSWAINANEWTKLIDGEKIESRKVTNGAMIEFVSTHGNGRHLDLGCGEGWLIRALSTQGIDISGADGTLELIETARGRTNIDYHHLTYEQIVAGETDGLGSYDTIIFNYSLYGKELTDELLSALHMHLRDQGKVIIQTVHPYFLLASGGYESRWIHNAWSGLPGDFQGEHSWYCRTMSDWFATIYRAGYMVESISETTQVESSPPISILFSLVRR